LRVKYLIGAVSDLKREWRLTSCT